MLRSDGRILTTHTGSLPRPKPLREAIAEHEKTGAAIDPGQVREAVDEIVRHQIGARVDVVNDGEMGRVGFSTYAKERLTGLDGEARTYGIRDLEEFPELHERVVGETLADMKLPSCSGEVRYRDTAAVKQDVASLKAAAEGVDVPGMFMTAASPGVIAWFLHNKYYPSHEEYLGALADAMKVEYDAVHEAGLLLQIDCPDLATSRQMFYREEPSLAQFRRHIAQNVDALNHATRDIPPDDMRLHLCWGNYEGPHQYDVALRDILDIVLTARPAAISFEAANPRHQHEWRVFEDVKLPEDKVILPGVIDSTTNFVEHPELVAERLVRFANIVGRERVLASSDCGFETFSGYMSVQPEVTWAKLSAMAEGAELASHELW
ncbi:MAG: hypothetical protein GEU71_06530 [Actinobacteria bacterium]|nr:hypothetical protein [Actinomycetota bacterium]